MRISTALWPVIGCLALASQAGAQVNQTYFYDVHGRLQATTVAPANGGVRVLYGLDAADNRSSRNSEIMANRAVQDELRPWENLLPAQALVSLDGRFAFRLQSDGAAVIYGPSGPLWSTNTVSGRSTVLAMQADGNLVIRGPANEAVWDSGTSGHPGAVLVMHNDGNLIIDSGGVAVWQSGTGGH